MLPVEGLFKESAIYLYRYNILVYTFQVYVLCELRQSCVVVVSFFTLKPFHQLEIDQQLDTLADKHTNCSVTSLPARNAKMP